MKERIVAPFGVSAENCQGLLDGKECQIVFIATHTEKKDAVVVYYLPTENKFYFRTKEDFISMADDSLKEAVAFFFNTPVCDDAMDSNYRHFKGMWYRLMVIADDAITGEAHCIYMPLYGDGDLAWCRPFDMFFSTTDGYPEAKQPYRLMNFHEVEEYFGKEQTQKFIDTELKDFFGKHQMQLIKETTIIRIGKTTNGITLTKEVIEPILESIKDVPIVYNKEQGFKNYNQDLQANYLEKLPIIGKVIGNAKIIGNKVVADIELEENYVRSWKGKPDNWCILLEIDDKKVTAINQLISFEIF